jgi:signal peptidase I
MAADEQGPSVSEGAASDGALGDGVRSNEGTSEEAVDNGVPTDRVSGDEAVDNEDASEGVLGDGAVGDGSDMKRQTRWWVELLVVVVGAVVIAFLLRTFVVATYSIPSGSMEPTLMIGDRIVVNKLSYHLHGVDTGNIVVFSTPPTENCGGAPVTDLVKRVIGLPGQTVSLFEGRVYIDDAPLPEPWLPPAVRTETYPGPSLAAYSLHHPYRVPSGDVYVMGDNRPESCDSRYWGPIRESTIVGKVDVRIWPLSRIGFF